MSPRLLAAVAALSAFAASLSAHAQAVPPADAVSPDWTVSANLGLANEYRYRGLMQTGGHPAVQGGVDVAHKSGFYVGNWNSNISWLDDGNADVSAPIEIDLYAGYKTTVAKVVQLDVGVLRYLYPGDYPSPYTSPNTTELYASAGWGPLSFKVSHATTNLFGFAGSKGSRYYDLTGTFPTGWWDTSVIAHVGYQDVRGVDDASYTDWRVGVSKTVREGMTVSLSWLDTNAARGVYTNPQGRYLGRGAALATLVQTF